MTTPSLSIPNQPLFQEKRAATDTSLDDKVLGSLLEDRVQRLTSYLIVVGAFWGVAALFSLWKSGLAVAAMPIVVLVTIICLAIVERKRWLNRPTTINLFLVANYAGLVCASTISQLRESNIEFYFAMILLMAVQLLGMKVAVRWFVLGIIGIFVSLYSPFISAEQLILGNALNHLAGAISLSLLTLWICDQSERCYVRRSAQLQLLSDRDREKSRMLKLAEETASIGHWRLDLRNGEVVFSDELKRICELPRLERIEELVKRFDSPGRETFVAALEKASCSESSFSLELSFQHQGRNRHIMVRGFSELGATGNVESVFGVIRDETTLREATQRLSKKADELNELASVDTLTGLYNRGWFRKQLEVVIEDAKRQENEMALIVLDMDGFKEINDTLGHSFGDLVLVETANRIKKLVGPMDVVSRLGGDEFTVIVRHPKSSENVQNLCQQIVDSIRTPMEFEDTKMQVGASIGLSMSPADSTSAEELFTFADTAMYDAKFNAKDYSVYRPEMTEELIQRKKVEGQLSVAISKDEFALVYQPQFTTFSRQVVGFEALIRWNHDGKIVSPSEFIPVLESSGHIIEAGQWILDESCRQLALWQGKGYDTRVAINISPVQFRDPEFYNRIVETLDRHKVLPSCVDLEITEGAIISDVNHTAETLKKLKSLGCMISIDDFGTGYSSLAYLKDFPIDQLKIDQAFVRDIPNHDDGVIASSIVILGLSLDLEVLAEGVESEEQLEFLKMHNCEYFQGYLGSKPLPPEECEALLAEQLKFQHLAGELPSTLRKL